MHIVDPDGAITSAGDAVVRLLAVFPRSRPVSWAARLLPPLRARIARQYEDLAARRGELAHTVPDAEPTVVRPAWVKRVRSP